MSDGPGHDEDASPPPSPVHVTPSDLSPDVLRAVIENFVLREGTDYGEVEASLESKVADVRRQLDAGEARIVFDPVEESVSIVTQASEGSPVSSSTECSAGTPTRSGKP